MKRDANTKSLELALEDSKKFSNLRYELLQLLYDRRTIAERYLNGEACVHIHPLAGEYGICAAWPNRETNWVANNS